MDTKTVRRLRRRFTLNALLALFVVIVVIEGLVFAVNLMATRSQIRETMDYIAERDGEIQDAQILYQSAETGAAPAAGESAQSAGAEETAEEQDAAAQEDAAGALLPDQSAETGAALLPDETAQDTPAQSGRIPGRSTYDMREFFRDVIGAQDPAGEAEDDDLEDSGYLPYFCVTYLEDGTVETVKANHMEGLTAAEAVELADSARGRLLRLGQYGDYYYNVRALDGGGEMVIYLNAETQVSSTSRLLYSAMIMTGAGAVIVFFLLWLFSTRAIAPLLESAERQQQFITNASHELKTPLAVIKANTEMQELLGGENEWTASTLRQIDRMNALIQNLVTITRAQESGQAERQDMDIACVVKETADTYLPVAQQEGKHLTQDLPGELRMRASDAEIRQLATLLLDNAIKYCDEGGTIGVRLSRKGKETILCVFNSFAEGKDVDYSRFFERFYRGEEAHTVEGSSGFGIGLSIAQSLCESYRGSIRAEWKDGNVWFTCTLR